MSGKQPENRRPEEPVSIEVVNKIGNRRGRIAALFLILTVGLYGASHCGGKSDNEKPVIDLDSIMDNINRPEYGRDGGAEESDNAGGKKNAPIKLRPIKTGKSPNDAVKNSVAPEPEVETPEPDIDENDTDDSFVAESVIA